MTRLAPVLACGVILAACGSEPAGEVPEDRQFANEPVPTQVEQEETTEPDPTAVMPETSREQPVATPETLLRTRGAPSTLYTVSNNDLVAVSIENADLQERVIDLPENSAVFGLDASPTGDRVAVLIAIGPDSSPAVAFFGSDGTKIGGPHYLQEMTVFEASPVATPVTMPGATPAATPVADPVGGDTSSVATPVMAEIDSASFQDASIAWIPQGNGALVVWDNSVYSIDAMAGVSRIETEGVDGTIRSGAVSPTNDEILLHVAADEGYETGYLIETERGNVAEIRALRTEPDEALSELTWLPTGSGVVYVQGELDGDLLMRGQLFSYELGQEVPQLIATSGQGGPSATITAIEVSPDGRSVAHDVSIRDRGSWFAHSLWVRSLRPDASAVQVPVDNGEPLTGLAWTRAGLVWMQTPDGGTASMRLMQKSGDVVPVAVVATPQATPIASPVVATPVTVGP